MSKLYRATKFLSLTILAHRHRREQNLMYYPNSSVYDAEHYKIDKKGRISDVLMVRVLKIGSASMFLYNTDTDAANHRKIKDSLIAIENLFLEPKLRKTESNYNFKT